MYPLHEPPEPRGPSVRTPHRPSRRASAVGLALALPLVAAPAVAAIGPVSAGHEISVFPGIDMVGAAGYDGDVVIEVWRDDVRVGTSGAPADGALLELNHDGPPCWSGVTPDIIAGDEVRVMDAGTLDSADPVGEAMTVANIDAEPARLVALDADGVANDLVMTGTASNDEGTAALPLAEISAELVQPAWRDNGWDSRALGTVPGTGIPATTATFADGADGVHFYDPVGPENPLGNHWTAVWKNMPEPHGTLALSGEQVVIAGVEGAGGITLMDAEDASGPGVGCPAAAADAVVSTTPSAAGIAFVTGTTDLQVTGTAYNAAAVRVTVDDADGDTTDAATVTATLSDPAGTGDTTEPVAPRPQTWSAAVPNGAFDRLADGDLLVSAQFDRVVEKRVDTTDEAGTTTTRYTHEVSTLPGRTHTLLKDTVAPATPTATPPGGRYTETQAVRLSAADEVREVVRYRLGPDLAGTPDPTASSPRATGPVQVTTRQTLKAAAFDAAGNASVPLVEHYNVAPLAVPEPPTAVGARAGTASATVSWTAPTDDGGSAILGWAIDVYRDGVSVGRHRVDDGAATSAVVPGLRPGVPHTFRVRAVNLQGDGKPSTPTAAVVPAAHSDTTPPTVVASTPGDGTRMVTRTAVVTATFSEPVRGASAGTVLLRDVAGAVVPATVTYDPALRTVRLTPTGGMPDNSRMSVEVTRGVTDLAGNALAAPVRWSFSTGPAPRITARRPGPDVANVARGAAVRVTFSEPVTRVSRSTVLLVDLRSGRRVPALVSYNSRTRTATLNPYGFTRTRLPALQRFRVEVVGGNRGIVDATRDPLRTTRWGFRTGR